MNKRAAVIGLAFVIASSGPLRAEASIACEFVLLKYTHEGLLFCGEKIDAVSESRYQKVAEDFLDFIAAIMPD
jgi:hypothetical protein